MSSLKLNGSTSGYVEIVPPAVAGNNSVTLPSGSGTLVTGDSGGNLNVSGIVTATSFSGNLTGNVTIGAGSTASPSLSPTGDSNTGIFFPAADTIAFGEGGAEALRIASNGYVGIGTANPNELFEVRGTENQGIRLTSTATSGEGANLQWYSEQSGDNKITAEIESDGSGTGGNLFFKVRSTSGTLTEAARILNNGGFRSTTTGSYENTSAPHHEFVTTGNSNIMNIYHTDSNGGNCGGLYLKFTNAAPNGTGLAFRFDDNAAMRFLVRTNGGIANYQSNDSNLCDEREKKNIEALDSTWNCLKEWELKKFHYNEDDDADNKRYGVIAQQVANHCPEVISEWIKQEAQEAKLDEEGNEIEPAKEEIVRMGVKEQQMMWMAIKALQEAMERIETLEAEVAALKNS